MFAEVLTEQTDATAMINKRQVNFILNPSFSLTQLVKKVTLLHAMLNSV